MHLQNSGRIKAIVKKDSGTLPQDERLLYGPVQAGHGPRCTGQARGN